MNQSEQIIYTLGNGAARITELSNTPTVKIPNLAIMLPAEVEVINQGYSDAIVAHHPAQSITLHSKQVEQLYALLKGYFEG